MTPALTDSFSWGYSRRRRPEHQEEQQEEQPGCGGNPDGHLISFVDHVSRAEDEALENISTSPHPDVTVTTCVYGTPSDEASINCAALASDALKNTDQTLMGGAGSQDVLGAIEWDS